MTTGDLAIGVTDRRARLLDGLGITLGALTLLSGTGLIAVSAWLISMASLQPPLLVLTVAVVAVRAFAVGRAVSRYAERLTSHEGALRALSDHRARIFDHLARGGLPVLLLRRGQLLSTVVTDVDALADRPLRIRLPVLAAGLSGAVIVAVTAWLLPGAAATLGLLLLLAGVLAPAVARTALARAERSSAAARGRLASLITRMAEHHEELAVLGALPAQRSQAMAEVTALAAHQRAGSPRIASAMSVGAAIQGVSLLALTALAIDAHTKGTLAGVNVAVISLLSLAAFEGVLALGKVGVIVSRVHASEERISGILALPGSPARPPAGRGTAPDPSGAGSLTMVDVRLRWEPQGPPVVAGLQLALPAGARLLITGPSGAGKSTLVAALTGLIGYEGTIRVGGAELRSLDEETLRRTVAAALQDCHLFSTTVAENLAVAAPRATRAQLADACAVVELTGRLQELPAGLDTEVGTGGTPLSGGEVHRLGLARAWLSPARLVIYDEPTEHLDRAMGERILHRLLDPADPRTRIVISHQRVPPTLIDLTVELPP